MNFKLNFYYIHRIPVGYSVRHHTKRSFEKYENFKYIHKHTSIVWRVQGTLAGSRAVEFVKPVIVSFNFAADVGTMCKCVCVCETHTHLHTHTHTGINNKRRHYKQIRTHKMIFIILLSNMQASLTHTRRHYTSNTHNPVDEVLSGAQSD